MQKEVIACRVDDRLVLPVKLSQIPLSVLRCSIYTIKDLQVVVAVIVIVIVIVVIVIIVEVVIDDLYDNLVPWFCGEDQVTRCLERVRAFEDIIECLFGLQENAILITQGENFEHFWTCHICCMCVSSVPSALVQNSFASTTTDI